MSDNHRTHTHVIGGSESGTSLLLECLMRDTLKQGKEIPILDPHGDLYESVLKLQELLATRKERIHVSP